MYNVLGVITEYNPFHNGHLYHLAESKKITGSDFVVAVMSGNFVERGDTSIFDKWAKTKMAILNGVDLVLELPTIFAISSSENFAFGAVKILNSLGIVNYLSFGSESPNLDLLTNISDIFLSEPQHYKQFLKEELDRGISFPVARENALLKYNSKYKDIVSKPNNILGIEYLKALKRLSSSISPITIKRNGSEYNETNIENNIASSTAIRKLVNDNNFSNISDVVPKHVFSIINEKIQFGEYVKDLSMFEKEIIYNLRNMSVSDISEIQDVSEGLENLLKSAANQCNTLDELLLRIKSKRYTRTRIQRILLYILLGITKDKYNRLIYSNPYIRVLGMNNKGKQMLSNISSKNVDIVTSVKTFLDNCKNDYQKEMLELDIFATNVYTLGYKHNSKANLDFTNKLILT